jgi:hypothetical protein
MVWINVQLLDCLTMNIYQTAIGHLEGVGEWWRF